MMATNVTMKLIPEKRFRVKENKWLLKNEVHTNCISINLCKCIGCSRQKIVVHAPAITKKVRNMRVRVLS